MAVFNEIDEGGLNGILTRRLGMPGGSPAPSLAPEIMPQLVLESDRPEWGWPKGELRCAGSFFVAAVAGQYSYVEFFNPSTSGSLITISYIENIAATDVVVQRIALSGQAGGATEYGGLADLRFGPRTHQLDVRSGSAALLAGQQGTFARLYATLHPFDGAIVMPPNTLVRIAGETVNSAITFNIRWYERVAQSGELV